MELFDRSRKPVQLRPGTEAQHEQISRLAALLRQLVQDLRNSELNRMVIASQHALTTTLAPAILRKVQPDHDNLHVRLRSANSDECYALLLSGAAGIGLVYRIPGERNTIEADFIETISLGMERLLPVFARGESKDSLLATDELPCIMYPDEVFLGRVMTRMILPQIHYRVRAKVETALTHAAMELATQGLGIAWVPASLATSRIQDGSLQDLSDRLPHTEMEITAVRLSGQARSPEKIVWKLLQLLHYPLEKASPSR